MTGSRLRITNHGAIVGTAVKAVKLVTAEIMVEAIRICPQDTGNLARSITMRVTESPKEAVGVVGTPVHYAPHVEFGTRFMAAQPFLGPALEQARRKYG